MQIQKLLIFALFLLPSSLFAQDSLEYYREQNKAILSEDPGFFDFEGKDEGFKLAFLNFKCEEFYQDIQIFIKVVKYEDDIVLKVRRDSPRLKELRKLRNEVCKKHVEIMERRVKLGIITKEKVFNLKWKYTVFLK